MGSSVTSSGFPAARQKLADLASRLRAAAAGAVVQRAAQAIQAQIDKVSRRIVEAHRASGDAADTREVTTAGGLVSLTANRYLGYHVWWIFRSGMPPFVVTRAVKIFAGELQAAITGQPSPLFAADDAAEEKAAAASRARFKKETARIFRRSAEGRAKRKEQARIDRAINRRARAEED